ncbi:MAG: peptidylprolyl isomerase [Parvularculaceae bacterium]
MRMSSVAAGAILAILSAGAGLAQKPDAGAEKAKATAAATSKLEKAEKKAAKAEEKRSKDPLTPYGIADAAPADAWRVVPLENLVAFELPAGPVFVEMRPDIAPAHIAQIKTLVKRGFYNGVKFHRVIEGFVAQGGDPKGDGTGGSDLPDIKGEFVKDTKEVSNFVEIGRDRVAARVGFIDGMPAGAQPESLRTFRTDRRVEIWPLHCPGILSMARSSKPDSANSQFFILLGDARLNLDRGYTVWGMIVDGAENSRRIDRGEPPKRPTPIVRAQMAADMPASERPKIEVMRTDSESFKKYVEALGAVKEGYVKDVCDITAPRRVNGKLEVL